MVARISGQTKDCGLKHVGYIVLLNRDPGKLQLSADLLHDVTGAFGIHFADSRSKVLLQSWIIWKPVLVLLWEKLGEVSEFSYLGSFTSTDCGRISEEVPTGIQKARLWFTSMICLWCLGDIHLLTRGCINPVAIRLVLLYSLETRSLRAGGIRWLLMSNTVFS